MTIKFTNQYLSLIFLINGLLIILFFYIKKKRKKRAIKFGNYDTLQKVAGKNFLKTSNILLVTKLIAVTSLLIGLSNPHLVEKTETTKSDYIIAIDSSASMFTSDIKPSRFQVAKDTASKYIKETGEGRKVGLVSYSGKIEKTVKPTYNKEKVVSKLKNLGIGEEGGTNIGKAIDSSVTLLRNSKNSKKIILITDGKDTENNSLEETLERANSQNISIYTLGIGEKQKEKSYRIINGTNTSEASFPNIDRDQLKMISNKTGGKSFFASNKSALKTKFLSIGRDKVKEDLSSYFILFSVVLIIFEWIFRSTKYEVLP